MGQTLGYHVVKSTYGMWLPGDDRGSWSEAWDEQIGFIEPHELHPGDPVRLRMSKERMKHPPLQMSDVMREPVAESIAECIEQSAGGLAITAAAIESTHMHLLIPYSGRDIEGTIRWLSDQSTKSVHQHTVYTAPLWCKGRWREFVFDVLHWRSLRKYIERHNTRRGLEPRPFAWLGYDPVGES